MNSARKKWRDSDKRASLSALATAVVAVAPAGAYAGVVFHSGPDLTFPVELPGAEIRSLQTADFATSFYGTLGLHKTIGFDKSFREIRENLFGVTFQYAKRGSIFNPAGSQLKRIGITGNRFFRVYAGRAYINPWYPNIAAAKAAITTFMGFQKLTYTHFFSKRSGYLTQSGALIGFQATVTKTGSRPFFEQGATQYVLFRFPAEGHIDYGWLELQNAFGPEFELLAYAYDTSGNPIPAGYTGIPEPRQLPLALSALSLGAVGLREWRKKRGQPTA